MLRARTARRLAATLGLTVAAAAPLPAGALADSGSSAGDQQYVDPLSGSSGSSSRSSTQTASAGANSSSSSASAGASSSAPSSSGVTQATPASAGTPTAATATSSGTTLPYTGYDGGLAAAIGGGLIVGGFVLRRRSATR